MAEILIFTRETYLTFCTCILALVRLVLHIEIYIKFNKIRGNSYIFYYLQLIVPKSKSVSSMLSTGAHSFQSHFHLVFPFGLAGVIHLTHRPEVILIISYRGDNRIQQQSTGRPGATPEGRRNLDHRDRNRLGEPQGHQQRGGIPQGPPPPQR